MNDKEFDKKVTSLLEKRMENKLSELERVKKYNSLARTANEINELVEKNVAEFKLSLMASVVKVLEKEMLYAYQNNVTKISIIGLSNDLWSSISDLKKIAATRVLKELMINMKKYSHASHVVLTFKKDKKNVNISYVDNGIGIKTFEFRIAKLLFDIAVPCAKFLLIVYLKVLFSDSSK